MTSPDVTEVDGQLMETSAVVRHIVRLVAPLAVEDIVDELRLIGDLGFHSLALAELVFTLEDTFGIEAVSPELAMSLQTVGDIAQLIDAAIESGDAKPASVADVRLLSAQYGEE
jgi:acyl carrier protein